MIYFRIEGFSFVCFTVISITGDSVCELLSINITNIALITFQYLSKRFDLIIINVKRDNEIR